MKKIDGVRDSAINLDERKEVLNIEIGENESAKYWLGVLNSLKNRGLKDILILCADGLTGLKDESDRLFHKPKFGVASFIKFATRSNMFQPNTARNLLPPNFTTLSRKSG